MKQKTKKELIGLFVFLFLIVLLISNFAVAYVYYIEDVTVPEQEKLDVQNKLLADLFTGAAVYTHPIDVPPGTNGLRPPIILF